MNYVKTSLTVFLKAALGIFICFFTVLSFVSISSMIATEQTGYTVYNVTDEGRTELLYEYSFDEGEDIKYAEYEAQGLKLMRQSVRSSLSEKDRNVTMAIAQAATLIIITAIVYVELWNIGNKDLNRVMFERMQADKLKGLKIGILSGIPSDIVYLLLWLARGGIIKQNYLPTFRMLNSHLYGLTHFVYGNTVSAPELSVWQTVILGITVIYFPLVCAVSYLVGYKDISIRENLIYKRKREAE